MFFLLCLLKQVTSITLLTVGRAAMKFAPLILE